MPPRLPRTPRDGLWKGVDVNSTRWKNSTPTIIAGNHRTLVYKAHKGDPPRERSDHRARHPKMPLRETLAIVRVIATRQATITDLTRAVRMSRATVYRLLTGCKRDLEMQIDCESRIFKVRDWGVLNRRRVMEQR